MTKLRNLLIVLAGMVCAFFIFGFHVIEIEHATDMVSHQYEKPGIRVIAHRGASANITEHTFEAYDKALEEGCRQIELDVYRSKDGTLYVSHDPTTNRLTGQDYIISETNDEVLSGLTVANGERLHTVQEFFNHFGNRVLYLIELKEGTPALDSFQALIEKNPKLKKSITVQTWDVQSLIAIDSRYPDMFKQLLMNNDQNIESYVKCGWIDSFAVNFGQLKKEDIDLAHEHDKQVWGWTINKQEEIERCRDMGADGVITDDPALGLELMKK